MNFMIMLVGVCVCVDLNIFNIRKPLSDIYVVVVCSHSPLNNIIHIINIPICIFSIPYIRLFSQNYLDMRTDA